MSGSAVVVDDHEEFRRSAQGLLERAGWSVVALAESAEDAVAAVRELHPDLVLIDIGLAPDGPDGIEVAEVLAGLDPRPQVILVSARDGATYGARLVDAPVQGFVPKGALSASAVNELVADG